MTGGDFSVRWYTVLVCISEILEQGELALHLWDKCRDQYSWNEWEEMQGDTVLGQSVRLNFQIVCMVAQSWCSRNERGTVLPLLSGMPLRLRGRCTGICSGRPTFVLGRQVFGEGRIYERGLFSFRDWLIQYMITWKSHFVFSLFGNSSVNIEAVHEGHHHTHL